MLADSLRKYYMISYIPESLQSQQGVILCDKGLHKNVAELVILRNSNESIHIEVDYLTYSIQFSEIDGK